MEEGGQRVGQGEERKYAPDERVGRGDVLSGILPLKPGGFQVHPGGEQAVGQRLGKHVGEGILAEVWNQHVL